VTNDDPLPNNSSARAQLGALRAPMRSQRQAKFNGVLNLIGRGRIHNLEFLGAEIFREISGLTPRVIRARFKLIKEISKSINKFDRNSYSSNHLIRNQNN